MPIYAYKCECGNTEEIICQWYEEQICECGKPMQRQVSAASFQIKGACYQNGWGNK